MREMRWMKRILGRWRRKNQCRISWFGESREEELAIDTPLALHTKL
jgi:hypothetical protein